jgi:hypothetical protein
MRKSNRLMEDKMLKNRLFYVFLAVAIITVVGLTFREALATTDVVKGDAARWIAMGEYYTEKSVEAEHLERGWTADSARWTAMGEFFAAQKVLEAQNLMRGRAADAARWAALGDSIIGKQEALLGSQGKTASVMSSSSGIERGLAADTARWSAMGKFYAAKQAQEALLLQRARDAYAARWAAIGAYWSMK